MSGELSVASAHDAKPALQRNPISYEHQPLAKDDKLSAAYSALWSAVVQALAVASRAAAAAAATGLLRQLG